MASISGDMSCGLCGGVIELHRHHIDWDHSNNSSDNVITICRNCHDKLHEIGHMSKEELLNVREKVKLRDPDKFTGGDSNKSGQGSLF